MSPNKTVKIAPSILSADFARLGEQVAEAEQAGADCLHIDVMDGHFVPPITFGPVIVEAIRPRVMIPLEIHMMVRQPENHFAQLKDAGADRVIIHQEASPHLHLAVSQLRDMGLEPGVALNPGTALSTVEEVASDIALLLIMTVNPGWGGQPFIPSMLRKIARARQLLDRECSDTILEVDGGIKSDNVATVVNAGADQIVAGSAIFNDSVPVSEAMAEMRAAVCGLHTG